ncbi:MAG TPA: hypothetical protein VIN39_07075 [Candidatus Dormibacteraeota bacterium]
MNIFIRYYVELAHPMPDLERVLFRAPSSWLPDLAQSADERGQRLLTEVGFRLEGHRIVKKVLIAVGDPVRSSARTWLPISWQATGPSGLFPVLDGDFEIATLGAQRTQLAFSARYRPPLGLIGRAVDRALLSRVAEATVKDFVDRIAERLNAQMAQLESLNRAWPSRPPTLIGRSRGVGQRDEAEPSAPRSLCANELPMARANAKFLEPGLARTPISRATSSAVG